MVDGVPGSEARPRNRLRAAHNAIKALAVLAFCAAAGLHTWYGVRLPKCAEPAVGRVYALVHHGTTVYMTRTEQHVLLGLFGGAILGIVVAVALRVADGGLHYRR